MPDEHVDGDPERQEADLVEEAMLQLHELLEQGACAFLAGDANPRQATNSGQPVACHTFGCMALPRSSATSPAAG